MKYYDVFNGDADGICALHQLRLARPVESTLITGVKRKINLLDSFSSNQDFITVLDISLDKNRDSLLKHLESGSKILYFDHHFAGEIPDHTNLETHINTEKSVCTSLLVNGYLSGQYARWAVTAAFGDNMGQSARILAKQISLNEKQTEKLNQLGTLINYNGYGSSLDDLHYTPDDLYLRIKPYNDPFDFIDNDDAFEKLSSGYERDISNAEKIMPELLSDKHAIIIFPDDKWARRVSGVYANQLARENPDRAHALLTEKADGGYLVSVRSPVSTGIGADDLCRQFPSGGGRKAAAGINHLPEDSLDEFRKAFLEGFQD
jgi:single-stranded DNA-specific DHH superfamily exonuclease